MTEMEEEEKEEEEEEEEEEILGHLSIVVFVCVLQMTNS